MRFHQWLFMIFVSGTWISSAAFDTCYHSWTRSRSPVALSIKPDFKKTESSIGRRTSNLSWNFHRFDKFNDQTIEGVPDYPSLKKWGSTEYTAVRLSYKGNAKIRVTIEHEKLRPEKCSVDDFQIRSESPTRARVFLTNGRKSSFVFAAFTRVAWMQDKIWNRESFCLDELTPGNTYQLCLALEDCQNSWSCKSFTTFEKNSVNAPLCELIVNVEGADSDWIQLSWPPPRIRRPATPPIGYILLVRSLEKCLEKAIYFLAPWITKDEEIYVRTKAENLSASQGCNGRVVKSVEGVLDGYWPDFPGSRRFTWVEGWNTAEVDEQGPVGLFATTIDNLRADTTYQFEISPVIFPYVDETHTPTTIRAKTLNENSGIKIEPRKRGVQIDCPLDSTILIKEIGAYPLHCNYGRPTDKNDASERFCRLVTSTDLRAINFPLTSGGVYRIKVNSIQKLLQIPAMKITFGPQIEATLISSNLFSLKLRNLNTTADNPPAFVTRICNTTNEIKCRNQPLYREVVGTYSLYENRSVWKQSSRNNDFELKAYLNTTMHSTLHVLLYAYFGDREELVHHSFVETRKTPCKNWCVWPAGDWTSTRGTAVGVYETTFARFGGSGSPCEDFCLPLHQAIDGESGCIDKKGQMNLCNIPICSDVAQLGCVTDTEFESGTTWISAQWENPRELVHISPHYLIMITSNDEADQCRAFSNDINDRNLPPFIQTIRRSCSSDTVNELLSQSSVNITNLDQNTTYNIFVIPYLLDGRIGAILEKTPKTRLAPPCQVKDVKISILSNLVVLNWRTMLKRDCGQPTSLAVHINDAIRTVNLYSTSQSVSFRHNFEFCREYTWQLEFENSAGRTFYPKELRKYIGYPDIEEIPVLYYASGSKKLGASFTSNHFFCKYEYVLQWGVWPDLNNCEVKFGYPSSIELPPLQEGLVYNFRARVQPRGASSGLTENRFASNWSETLVYTTLMSKSEVKSQNQTVTAYTYDIEDQDGEQLGCLFPKGNYDGKHEFRSLQRSRLHKTKNTSVCVIVDWVVQPNSADFILGYILEMIQSRNNSCRVFWIPCEDCFPSHNLINALPEVVTAMTQIKSSCLGIPPSPHLKAERLDSRLYKSTTRLLIAFQVIGVQKDNFEGVIRVHAVKMGSVHQIMEQTWQTNSQVILSKTGMQLGVVATVVVFLSMIILTVLFIIKRKRWIVRHDQYMKELTEDEMAAEIDSSNKIQNKLLARLRSVPMPIPISDFTEAVAKYAQNDYATLRDEYATCLNYAALQQDELELTIEAGAHPKNRLRNRYRNICPYDQNRFKLKKEYALEQLCPREISIPNALPIALTALSDYVNASVIPSSLPQHNIYFVDNKDGFKGPSAYIAAQAPKEQAVGLFWQAIWDSEVRLIVMLTRIRERDREKCFPYWPGKHTKRTEETSKPEEKESCSEVYGNISVTLHSSESGICYIRRVFAIRDMTDNTCIPRRIIQLQMTGWDDFMVPRKDDFYIFLKRYWDDLAEASIHASIPVMVHCSAGVGRTGTFLAIDMLARYIRSSMTLEDGNGLMNGKNENESIYANLSSSDKCIPLQNRMSITKCAANINIFQTVLWLRSQRMKTVEQEIQYIFIFDFLSYYIQHLTGEAEIAYENL